VAEAGGCKEDGEIRLIVFEDRPEDPDHPGVVPTTQEELRSAAPAKAAEAEVPQKAAQRRMKRAA